MAPIHIPFPGPLHEARFVERPNRFLLRCTLPPEQASGGHAGEPAFVREPSPTSPTSPRSPTSPGSGGEAGELVEVHMADPGRLKELLLPGKRVWIRYAASPTRKTDWSAVLVESPSGEGLVSVDTTMPNRLIDRALRAGALEELEGWALARTEYPMGRSRIDFLLTRDAAGPLPPTVPADRAGPRKLALEVKSVTLVDDGVALFPDAITARGARHVRELAAVAGSVDEAGARWEAAILFVLQRPDAHRIEAARSIDPDFADALAEAKAAGVRVLGRRCRVDHNGLELCGAVPVS